VFGKSTRGNKTREVKKNAGVVQKLRPTSLKREQGTLFQFDRLVKEEKEGDRISIDKNRHEMIHGGRKKKRLD